MQIQPKYLFICLIFFLGLLTIDAEIRRQGDRLLNSPYWDYQVLNNLKEPSVADIFVIGGCRAALQIDPKIIQATTHLKTYNAGRVVEGLGNTDFTLNVILSKQTPKYMVIVLDDGSWEETLDTARDEVKKKLAWKALISPSRQDTLRARYGLYSPLLYSGLLRYSGMGEDLIYSAVRERRQKILAPRPDAYDPRSDSQDIRSLINSNLEGILRDIRKDFKPTNFSQYLLNIWIADLEKQGVQPIIVIPPMHKYRATNHVNDAIIDLATKISEKNKTPNLIYLNNSSDFANNNLFWSDQGHMNKRGAEAFSKILGADLEKIIRSAKK